MMTLTQFRLPKALLDEVDVLVKKGLYSNKSDVIRDAVRKLILENQIGSIPNSGDSVKEVRKIRQTFSKQNISLNELNKMN